MYNVDVLTSLRLRNFKAFKDTGDVEIAPLTVLTGPNSSGKSAVIRALMALRQTVESRDQSAAFVPTGSYVDLGPFEDFVFMHDEKASVFLDVDCKVPAGPSQIVGIPLTMPQEEQKISVSLELRYLPSSDRIYLAQSSIKSDPGEVRICKVTKGGKAIGRSYKTNVVGPGDLFVNLADTSTAKFSSTPPFHVRSFRSMSYRGNPSRLWATQLSKEIEDSILREFSAVCYVGPLRARPQRMYISTGEAPREVGTAGELGPAVLWSASEVAQLKLEERLSEWCSRMGIALEIELATIFGSYFQVHAVDPHTKAHMNLPDVGFGTSQILPILIQGLIANPGTTLLLEQPEIHLHPKVQADLADFLVEVSQRDVAVIVETHSEHIITRIQRRIAEQAFQPDHVALYYIIPSAEGSRFARVQLDSFGQIKHAPEGFFEEGFEETFALMGAVGERKARSAQPKLLD